MARTWWGDFFFSRQTLVGPERPVCNGKCFKRVVVIRQKVARGVVSATHTHTHTLADGRERGKKRKAEKVREKLVTEMRGSD